MARITPADVATMNPGAVCDDANWCLVDGVEE